MPYVQEPPTCYQHAYPGTVTEIILPSEQVEKLCNQIPHADACMWFSKIPGQPPTIVLPKVGIGGVSQLTQDALRRHEMAHCNGWPASHTQDCP